MKAHKQTEKITGLSDRINVRFDSAMTALINELIKLHNADGVSDYVRGLVILDALKADKKLLGISIPGWLTESLVFIRGSEHADKPQPGSSKRASSE